MFTAARPVKFEQIPLFCPRGCAALLLGRRPSLHRKGLLFIARASAIRLYRGATVCSSLILRRRLKLPVTFQVNWQLRVSVLRHHHAGRVLPSGYPGRSPEWPRCDPKQGEVEIKAKISNQLERKLNLPVNCPGTASLANLNLERWSVF